MIKRLIFLAGAVIVAGCGGSKTGSPAQPPGSGGVTQTPQIQISETEFSISPNTVHLSKAGSYTFLIANHGKLQHAFAITGQGLKTESSPIAGGQSTTLKVAITKPGSYKIYCPIDGHAGRGMQGTLVLGSAPGPSTTTGSTSSGGGGGGGGY